MLSRNIHDEDTIELQLSAAELQWLTQAQANLEAEAERPAPPTMIAAVPENADLTPLSVRVAAPPLAAIPADTAPVAAPLLAPAPADPSIAAPIEAATPAAAPPVANGIAAAAPATPAVMAMPAPARSVVAAPAVAVAVPAPVPLRLVPASPSRAPAALPERTPAKIQGGSTPPGPARGFQDRHVPVGVRTAVILVGVAVLAAFFFWPKTPTPAPVAAPTTTPTAAAPLAEPPGAHPSASSALAESPSLDPTAPVRFANPFDPTEVFEFPPGTSYVDARDQVAERLIARARERSGSQNSATNRQNRTMNGTSLARQL